MTASADQSTTPIAATLTALDVKALESAAAVVAPHAADASAVSSAAPVEPPVPLAAEKDLAQSAATVDAQQAREADSTAYLMEAEDEIVVEEQAVSLDLLASTNPEDLPVADSAIETVDDASAEPASTEVTEQQSGSPEAQVAIEKVQEVVTSTIAAGPEGAQQMGDAKIQPGVPASEGMDRPMSDDGDVASNAVEAASEQDPSSIELMLDVEVEEVSFDDLHAVDVGDGAEVVEESISLEDLTEGSPEPTEPEDEKEEVSAVTIAANLPAETKKPNKQPHQSRRKSLNEANKPSSKPTSTTSPSTQINKQGSGLQRNPSGKRHNDRPKPTFEGDRSKDGKAPESKEEAVPAKKPVLQAYVNPNRVASGGLDKKKLSPEELDRKMEEMRLKNAELMKKKEAAAADARAFEEAQKEIKRREEEERRRKREELSAKREKDMEAQAALNALTREREENAARKAKAMAGREWDKDKEHAAFVAAGSRTGRPRGPSHGSRNTRGVGVRPDLAKQDGSVSHQPS
ncbi:hypothetical protein HDU67_007062 [Dinochytrium kinnereticum]|nr:hypothetical protein HDU67_007062 [Dinochytrium kinnereticum]